MISILDGGIHYSASAIAAATLMRAITGAIYPLFGQELFQELG
jgi:MFS transporter, DHA1 family, multidrug resistance protein